MMFRWCLVLLSLVFCTGVQAAFGVDQLMAELAQNKGGRARFVEKRHIALLDKPVQSSGDLVYAPPDRLEKRTLLPKPEMVVLDRDTLSLERDRRRMSISLSSRPEARAFVESIRSTLSGNRQALEQHYSLQVQGASNDWTLTLVPTEPTIAKLLQRITVSGSGSQVRHIDYLLADGDRTEMAIDPVDAP